MPSIQDTKSTTSKLMKSNKSNKSVKSNKSNKSNKSVKSVKSVKSMNIDTDPVDTAPVDTDPVDTAPVDTDPVDTDPVDTAPVDTDPVDTVQSLLKRINRRNLEINALQRENKADHKQVEKQHLIDIRVHKLKNKHRVNLNGKKKAPSGFAKPTQLSEKMCSFLDVSNDTLLARTAVTKRITTYIKEQDLQNPKNKREIVVDNKLKELINMEHEGGNPLTYFNLQRCIKHHFPKKIPSETPVTTV